MKGGYQTRNIKENLETPSPNIQNNRESVKFTWGSGSLVIAIISILAAMLLPALQSASGDANRKMKGDGKMSGFSIHQWKIVTGDWKIKSIKEFAQMFADVDGLMVTGNSNWENYTVEAKLQMPHYDSFCGGIAFGLDNDLTGTLFYLTNPSASGMAKLQKMENGAIAEERYAAAPCRLKPGVWYKLRVEIRKSIIDIFVNDMLLITERLPDKITGAVGFWTSKGWAGFKDVKIYPSKGKHSYISRVNPLYRSSLRPAQILDGEWQFQLDPSDKGLPEKWFEGHERFPNKIIVPGAWQAQGFGELTKFAGMKDVDNIMGVVENAGPVDAGAIMKHGYRGAAWYQRTFKIEKVPPSHKVWLKFGGANSEASVWLNGVFIGFHNNSVTSFEFDVTEDVQCGENTLIVCVDCSKGTGGSFDMCAIWGGLFRSVEVEFRRECYLRDVVLIPDIDREIVQAEVFINNDSRIKTKNLKLCAVVRSIQGKKIEAHTEATVSIPAMSAKEIILLLAIPDVKLWSPVSPNLYRIDIQLIQDGKPIDGLSERFGMRKIEVRGTNIYLNNKPIFLRGYGSCGVYPLTLCPPADRKEYRNRLQKARAYGFNYVRNHTWVPLQEFFDIADEFGIMVEIEPYNSTKLNGAIDMHRNHPSLILYSMSNESWFGNEYVANLYRYAKRVDPTRLAIDSDGCHGEVRPTCDIWTIGRRHSPDNPAFDKLPVVDHEFLNLPTLPDVRLKDKFAAGPTQLKALLLLESWAKEKGYKRLLPKMTDASYELQKIYQKEGIENARKHPKRNGYGYFMLIDLWGWALGLLDAFGERKGYGPQEFLQFNAESVLLAELPRKTFFYEEEVKVPLLIAHYGETPFLNATIEWSVIAEGKTITSGRLQNINASSYGVSPIGNVKFTIAERKLPVAARLSVRLYGGKQEISNNWQLWFFSKRGKFIAKPGQVNMRGEVADKIVSRYNISSRTGKEKLRVVDRLTAEDIDFLVRGGCALVTSLSQFNDKGIILHPGWWKTGRDNPFEQLGLVVEDEAVADFPHEGFASWQFKNLMDTAVDVSKLPFQVKPLIYGTTHPEMGKPQLRSVLFAVRVGKGVAIFSGMNLLDNEPESHWMLDALLRHASGNTLVSETATLPDAQQWLRQNIGINSKLE